MRSAIKLCAIPICCLVFVSEATAAAAKFDCDTASKRFSQLALPLDGQHVQVTGVISSRLVRKDDQWVPKMSIYLQGAERQLGGFSVSNQPDQPWNVTLLYDGKESAAVGSLKSFDPIPFKLDVNATSGGVSLNLGGNLFQGSGSPFQAAQLMFTCSTGEFLFDQLSWHVVTN